MLCHDELFGIFLLDVTNVDLMFGEQFSCVSLILQTVLDEATEPWGIKVERVEM